MWGAARGPCSEAQMCGEQHVAHAVRRRCVGSSMCHRHNVVEPYALVVLHNDRVKGSTDEYSPATYKSYDGRLLHT
eukprot:342987-Chlamydomonas_euryale.AAC.2